MISGAFGLLVVLVLVAGGGGRLEGEHRDSIGVEESSVGGSVNNTKQ
jgi:hypothetical protein